MAEEAKKKADAPAAAPAEKPAEKKEHGKAAGAGGGLLNKTPVLLGGVMLIEAVVLFAGFKFLGGAPKPSVGAELTAEDPSAKEGESKGGEAAKGEHGGGEAAKSEHGAAPAEHGGSSGAAPAKIDRKKAVEVQILKEQFPNRRTGRMLLYDVIIVAVVKGENKEKVEATIGERKALITDRVRTIIMQSDPEKLGGESSEFGLETLRRQVKYQLDEIVGEGMIDEVLVPRCIPFRSDY